MRNDGRQLLGLIRVLTGEYRSAEISLESGESLKVGRAATNNLIFENQKGVSRNHCVITWHADDGAFGVYDTSSTGTRRWDTKELLPKNDKALRLAPETVISIGTSGIRLLLTVIEKYPDITWNGLHPGMEIEGRYVVVRIMDQKPDSVIYRCDDKVLGMPVAIKAFRNDKEAEIEAKNMAHFRNAKDIVNIYGVIKHGETSFIVMEYIWWDLLSEKLKLWGKIGVSQAKEITECILDSVRKMHDKGVAEGVIDPGDIYINMENDKPMVKVYLSLEEKEDGVPIDLGINEIGKRLFRSLTGKKHYRTKKNRRGK